MTHDLYLSDNALIEVTFIILIFIYIYNNIYNKLPLLSLKIQK